jgi:hypothetical protein
MKRGTVPFVVALAAVTVSCASPAIERRPIRLTERQERHYEAWHNVFVSEFSNEDWYRFISDASPNPLDNRLQVTTGLQTTERNRKIALAICGAAYKAQQESRTSFLRIEVWGTSTSGDPLAHTVGDVCHKN